MMGRIFACGVSLTLLLSSAACGDGDDEQVGFAGNITIETAVGPEFEAGAGNLVQVFTAVRLVYSPTDEDSVHGQYAISDEARTVNGVYGEGGQIELGGCGFLEELPATDVTYIDAGDTITLTMPDGTEAVLDRDLGDDGAINYVVSDAFSDPFNPTGLDPSAFTVIDDQILVTFSGSDEVPAGTLEATLRMPHQPTGVLVDSLHDLADTEPVLTTGQDLTVTWDPHGGEVERAFVRFHDAAQNFAATIVCLVPDSGEFTIPAEIVDIAPTDGAIAIGYLLETESTVLNRDLQLLGDVCTFGPFTRQ